MVWWSPLERCYITTSPTEGLKKWKFDTETKEFHLKAPLTYEQWKEKFELGGLPLRGVFDAAREGMVPKESDPSPAPESVDEIMMDICRRLAKRATENMGNGDPEAMRNSLLSVLAFLQDKERP